MRTILIAIYSILLALISLPFLLIGFIIHFINPVAGSKYALPIVRIAFSGILFLSGAKKTIIGRERIPRDVPVLYTANHRSFYDILLAYSTVPTVTAFVSKDDLKKVPVVSWWMHILLCLFIDREDIKQQMSIIKTCIAQVQDGCSIYIAPEGTRNAEEELLPFKEGSFRIAHKTNCPIIPVCILNTENCFEKRLPWIGSAKILIEYGEPIYLDTLSKEDQKRTGAYVQKIVAQMYENNLAKIK